MDAPTDDERIRQHADLVYRTCVRITGNAQDAADVAQEVFVAWLRGHREIRGSVAAWLYGTARQRSLDWLRTKHRRDRHEQQAMPAVGVEVADEDWQIHLDAALEELPTPVRTLVVEHHLMGLTQGQLATRHRCTQATISRRLTQALDLLRSALRSRGVTASGAVLLGTFTAARANACPPALVAPVMAQAQMVGVSALVGPLQIVGWSWWMWSGVLAAGLLVVLAVGVAGVRWWAARTVPHLEADWLSIATAGLPPITPMPSTPQHGDRYPSIEDLIARLPPVDPTIQDALRALSHAGGSQSSGVLGNWAPFLALSDKTQVFDLASRWWHSRPATADEQKDLATMRDAMESLLTILRRGEASLTCGGWLAEEYRAGRLASWEQRSNFSVIQFKLSLARQMTTVLCVEAMAAPDPHVALTDLELLCRALQRGAFSMTEIMLARPIQVQRDGLYLRLQQQGTLSKRDYDRWDSETCSAQQDMGMAFLGDHLVIAVPLLQDLRAHRFQFSEFDFFGIGHRWSEVEMLRYVRWASELQPLVRASLQGDGSGLLRRHHHQALDTLFGKIAWPNLTNVLADVAGQVAHHRAVRAAAALIDAARQGQALPEKLPALVGEKPDAWAMVYERLSPTRFRFSVDPALVQPAYSLVNDMPLQVSTQLAQAKSSLDPAKSVVDSSVLIEVEAIPRPDNRQKKETPVPDVTESSDEPVIPSVAQ